MGLADGSDMELEGTGCKSRRYGIRIRCEEKCEMPKFATNCTRMRGGREQKKKMKRKRDREMDETKKTSGKRREAGPFIFFSSKNEEEEDDEEKVLERCDNCIQMRRQNGGRILSQTASAY